MNRSSTTGTHQDGSIESLGSEHYRVCGPLGCTIVRGLDNAQYLSRNSQDGGIQSRYLFND